MAILDTLELAKTTKYRNEDGEEVEVDFLPGLQQSELDAIEKNIGASLPVDFSEIAKACGVIEGFLEPLDFSGVPFEMPEAFPHGHAFAGDGYGNFWVVDCLSLQEETSNIYFVCHDAPVILYQCDGIETFLSELVREFTEPLSSLIHAVHEDTIAEVWKTNPGTVSRFEAIDSPDASISAFAEQLDERFVLVDLRNASPGEGFSWGRYGPQTELRRYGEERIFAYAQPQKEPGLFARIFARRGG